MQNKSTGTYVKDEVTGNIYYAVHIGFGTQNPLTLRLFSDIRSDPDTITSLSDIQGQLVPVTGEPIDNSGAGTPSEVSLVSNEVTPTYFRTSASGTIAAGLGAVSIANVGEEDAQVLGEVLPAKDVLSFSANGSDTLGAIAYDGSGTILAITTL